MLSWYCIYPFLAFLQVTESSSESLHRTNEEDCGFFLQCPGSCSTELSFSCWFPSLIAGWPWTAESFLSFVAQFCGVIYQVVAPIKPPKSPYMNQIPLLYWHSQVNCPILNQMHSSFGNFKYITKYFGYLVNSTLVWFLLYIQFLGYIVQLAVNLLFLI